MVVAAAVGGAGPAVAAAIGGSLAANWYFTEPFYRFTIAEAENALALGIFLVVALVVSSLVVQAAARSAESARSRAEVEALALAATELADRPDPLPAMVDRIRMTFGLAAAAVLSPRDEDDGWEVVASAGSPVPSEPPDDGSSVPLTGGAVLVMHGRHLTADDRRIVAALGAQTVTALERRRLEDEAATAAVLAEADELRTALLRAVSHDLRTPLASIKASVTSLLQCDVEWSPEAEAEFLATINEESDRLDHLVGNLLDMSRLQTGALRVALRPVGYEEVVPSALASLSGSTDVVDVSLDESTPPVEADPALLERAVANVVANAVTHSPPGRAIHIEAGAIADRVHLRVVDRGPGIPAADRERAFEPFQRFGDGATGVGLGLAVARGFVDAMRGELTLDDTPGGGLTVVISLPRAGDEASALPSPREPQATTK